jgi:hypothetical protein
MLVRNLLLLKKLWGWLFAAFCDRIKKIKKDGAVNGRISVYYIKGKA